MTNWYYRAAQRVPGRTLPETGYEYRKVNVYRAVPEGETVIRPMDYVAKSLEFARRHADHQASVEGNPYVVLKCTVPSSDVSEAYNPHEYFYTGDEVEGSEVYRVTVE